MNIPFPNKKYQIIYADPPWNYAVFKSIHGGRLENQHYQAMRITDIYEIPINEISDVNCILFLWVTYPMLKEGLYCVRAWGFDYKTVAFTWVKLNKKSLTPFFGMGQWTRNNAEICLLGIKGNIKRQDASVSQIIMTTISEHSKKPLEIRNRIVQLMGDLPRIELFARPPKDRLFEDESYKGWDLWGNEV